MLDLWPFSPLVDSSEKLEWLVEVMPSRTTEQRVDLREHPRQTLSYRFALNAQQYSKTKALVRANPAGDWFVPIWDQKTKLTGAISEFDTDLSFNTAFADYQVGGRAVLYQDEESFVVLEISAISPTELTFVGAVGVDMNDVIIAPVYTAFAQGGFSASRKHEGLTYFSVDFMVRDNLANAGTTFAQYLGADLMNDPSVIATPLSEKLGIPVTYVDNGFGPIEIETDRDVYKFMQSISFIDHTQKTRWERRQWFHSLRGKLNTFWLPTFNNDLVMQSGISNGANSVTVAAVMDVADYAGRHIVFDDGDLLSREITSAIILVNGDHRLFFSPVDRDLDIVPIYLLSLVRLDANAITLKHENGFITRVSSVVVEVPQ